MVCMQLMKAYVVKATCSQYVVFATYVYVYTYAQDQLATYNYSYIHS